MRHMNTDAVPSTIHSEMMVVDFSHYQNQSSKKQIPLKSQNLKGEIIRKNISTKVSPNSSITYNKPQEYLRKNQSIQQQNTYVIP